MHAGVKTRPPTTQPREAPDIHATNPMPGVEFRIRHPDSLSAVVPVGKNIRSMPGMATIVLQSFDSLDDG